MSHYARLIAPLTASTTGGEFRGELPIATPVKHVLCVDDGFLFHALRDGVWLELHTAEDLPAFTDRGRDQRGVHATRNATLGKGRPRLSSTTSTKRVVCKVTDTQYEHVERVSAQLDESVSTYVRKLLIQDGMPE